MTSIVQRVTVALMDSPQRTVKQLARLTGLPVKAVANTLHRLVHEGRAQTMPGPPRVGRRGRPEVCYSLRICTCMTATRRPPSRPRSPHGLTGSALMGRSARELAWGGICMPAHAAGRAPGAQRRAA
jgi:hypothetical protein